MKPKLVELNAVKRKIWNDYAKSHGIPYHELYLYQDTLSYMIVELKVGLLELWYRMLRLLGIVKLGDKN